MPTRYETTRRISPNSEFRVPNSEFRVPNSELRTAFTLVEMMIVLLIVAMGFLLVVGVGSTVQDDARARETRHTQAVLLTALEAYHDVHHAYPPGDDGGPDSSVALLRALRNEPACRSALQRLPREAVNDETGQTRLLDGFTGPLLYEPSGGLGGKRPRLSSKGHDPIDSMDDIVSE